MTDDTDVVMPVRLPAELSRLPTPCLLVDVDRLDRNITAMARLLMTRGIGLRPHIKTSKCWQVAERQIAAGASGFTCSTPAEVGWLSAHGASNLLWAHLPVGPPKVDFAVSRNLNGNLLIELDSLDVAAPVSQAAAAGGAVVKYLLEIDTGHHRTGVRPEEALRVARELSRLPGLELGGLITHEGHLATYGTDRRRLEAAGIAAAEELVSVAECLRDDGHDVSVVSVGSTPGATSAPSVTGVTEARPGTYVYYDANQVFLGSATLNDCALTVLASVVSVHPDRTIIDAGIKALSSDPSVGGRGMGIVLDDGSRVLDGVEFPAGNEEHGFLLDTDRRLKVGDRVRIVPNHACGATNMWSSVFAVHGSLAVEQWAIAARH